MIIVCPPHNWISVLPVASRIVEDGIAFVCSARSLASILHKIAAPASKSTASTNHAFCSLVLAPILPALGVDVADAVPVLDAGIPPALLLAELEVGVVDVSIVLAAEVTAGTEVTETGPGPRAAERLLLAFAERADAGNVASADAVRGMLKMLQIWAKAWNVVSCAVWLQLFTTHGLKICSTHVPFAQRHVQFDAVQLLPLTSATHGRAQLVTSPKPATTRHGVTARVETRMGEGRIVANR